MSSEKDTKAQGIHIYFLFYFSHSKKKKKKSYASIFIRLRIMDVHNIALTYTFAF